jgi:hypothetical protein
MKKRYENQETIGPQPTHHMRTLFDVAIRCTCGSALSLQRKAAVPRKRVRFRIHVQMLPDFAFDKNPVIVNINDAPGI